MSTALTTTVDRYSEWFAALAAAERDGAAAWFLPAREAAMAALEQNGFPTIRDEEWRFTNVAPLLETEFERPAEAATRLRPDDLRPYLLGQDRAVRLVFVKGRFAPALSDLSDLPAGLNVQSLANALAKPSAALRKRLAQHADPQQNGFAALNTALFTDGACVEVRRGAIVERPVHLLYVSTEQAAPTIVQARNLIVLGENSQCRVLEQYVSLHDGVHFTNAVTELIAEDNAIGHHCKLIRESEQTSHIATIQIHQERSSRVASHLVQFGGGLVRHDINPVLAGEGGDCELHGLYVLRGRQHTDIHLRAEHRAAHCESREVFRGILDGHSRGIFTGRIVVRPGAQRTDAKQTNMNLLLSNDAQVNSKPQLEIFADDVKCTHGSTTGQVDDEAIFYLRSRGVSEVAARSLLVYAFARSSLAAIEIESVRHQLEELMLERLPQSDLLRGVV